MRDLVLQFASDSMADEARLLPRRQNPLITMQDFARLMVFTTATVNKVTAVR
jgi:hypothetical protein